MPILSSDIQFLLSAPMAASGYSMPGVVGNSLGKYVSTSQLSQTILDNFFPDLTGAQNAGLQVDYQCMFFFNANSSDAMISPVAWLPSGAVSGPCNFAIGVDPTGPSALASSSQQAVSILNPTAAPAGVTTWYSPSATASGGVNLPNVPSLGVMAVWIRRTATGTPGTSQLMVNVTFNSVS